MSAVFKNGRCELCRRKVKVRSEEGFRSSRRRLIEGGLGDFVWLCDRCRRTELKKFGGRQWLFKMKEEVDVGNAEGNGRQPESDGGEFRE